MFKKRYIVEARLKDGSLNTKHYDTKEPSWFISGGSEDELFNWFFHNNKALENAGMSQILTWYHKQGLYPRIKTW